MPDLVDADQRALYELAGLDPDRPAKMLLLAALLGLGVREVKRPAFGGNARRIWSPEDDAWVVELRAGLSWIDARFALAHEIAEWWCRNVRGEPLVEDYCDMLAAALAAPRAAFRERLRLVGRYAFAQLALPFQMSETAAALRHAETCSETLLVVAPHRVRGRGLYLPTARVARELAQLELPGLDASEPAIVHGVGLRKARLGDDPRRVVIVIEEVG